MPGLFFSQPPNDVIAPPLRHFRARIKVNSMSSLYESDFHRWATEQAAALKCQRYEMLDWENLGEEIAGLARSERRELRNRLRVLLLHLLKWRPQPIRRGPGWKFTIDEQRERIAELLAESASLSGSLDEALKQAWHGARRDAMRATGLAENALAQDCPWPVSEALDQQFLPE